MNGESPDSAGTTSWAEQIDLACDAFEKKWHSQPRPSIDETLKQFPLEARPAAFRELLSLELELRRKAGETPTQADYQLQFADFGDELATIFSRSFASPTLQSLPGDATLRSVGDSADSPADQSVSRGSFGNYEVLEEIGHGGMGVVYKARHRKMKRLVALKVLPADVTRNKTAVLRFEREIEVISRLSHPNVVTAHDADESNGVHFLVMEYVAGEDLAALVRREGPLPVAVAVDYTLQAARGLGYAHRQGIVHRDVKPSNMLLSADGGVKILDLGLARLNETAEAIPAGAELTHTTTVMGTVDYMAPEQGVNTRHADERSDIYSLGCTLYYLLTGRAMYGGETVIERLLAHRDQPIPQLGAVRSDAPVELQAVFARMVAKRAAERFQSMDDVIAALQTVATSTSQPASAARPPANRRRQLIGAGFLAAALVLLAGIIIKITHKDGTTTEIEVPEGSRIQIANTPEKPAAAVAPAVAPEIGPPKVAAADALPVDPKSGLPLPAEPAALPPWELPAGAPEPAIVPFDPDQAKQHQAAWAKYLKRDATEKGADGLEFALIPPGEFTLSFVSNPTDPEGDDKLRHKVRLTVPFSLGTTEVTREQFGRFVEAAGYKTEPERNPGWNAHWWDPVSQQSGYNPEFNWRKPGGFDLDPQMPVTQISLADAAAYCSWLTQQDGMLYRLPTEAEWQFAFRAGGSFYPSNASAGSDLVRLGWLWSNQPQGTEVSRTAPITRVAQKERSPWGLFDQVGNAQEFCIGSVDMKCLEAAGWINPRGCTGYSTLGPPWTSPTEPNYRLRFADIQKLSWSNVGFRIVRELPDAGRYESDTPVRTATELRGAEAPLPEWKSPPGAPPLAVVPFSFAKARQHQERWGKYLKKPVEETNSIGMPLRLIPPGEFSMAASQDQQNATAKRERIRMTRAFYMGATEVSVAEFRKFAEATGYRTEAERNQNGWTPTPEGGILRSTGWHRSPEVNWKTAGPWTTEEDHPVTVVSADDANAFCQWLSKQEGARYRLPTEEEWSFACRAGINSDQGIPVGYGAISDWAWTGKAEGLPISQSPAMPVRSLRANPLGLHHMHGNVCEWCSRRAGQGTVQDNLLSQHGACWIHAGRADIPFADSPWLATPENSVVHVGFRVVRELDIPGEKSSEPGPEIQLASLSTAPISVTALVSRPIAIRGLKSWTVESRGMREPHTPHSLSGDGRWIASFGNTDLTIRLWNEKFELQRILFESERIRDIAISPDQRWLASRTRNGQGDRSAVSIWELDTGRLVRRVAHEGNQLEWSPDSRLLALGEDGYFEYRSLAPAILDVQSGQLTTLPGQASGSGALRVAWSPDGSRLLVTLWSGNPEIGRRVRLYDIQSQKLLSDLSLPELTYSLMVPVWSPQGDRVLLPGDQKVLIWSAGENKVIDGLDRRGDGYALWTADGKGVLVSDAQGLTLRNIADQKVERLISEQQRHARLFWLDRGKRLACVHSHGLWIYNAEDWKLLSESLRDSREDPSTSTVTVSPDGQTLVTHTAGGALTYWNAETGGFQGRQPAVHFGQQLAVSPDGEMIAVHDGNRLSLVGRNSKQVRELTGHTSHISCAAWSPDGRSLATASSDQTVRIWDAKTATAKHVMECEGPALGIAWSPDGELVAAVMPKALRIWKAASAEPARDSVSLNGEVSLGEGNPLAWTADPKQLLVVTGAQLHRVDWETGFSTAVPGSLNTALFLSLSPNNERAVVGRLNDAEYGHLLSLSGGPQRDVRWLVPGSWMPDSRRMVSRDTTRNLIRAFDLDKRELLGVLIPRLGGEQFVCISPDGHYRGSRRIDDHLVYVALHDDGSQKTYTPAEFSQKFGWKNDPQKARFLAFAPEDKPAPAPQPVATPEPTGQPQSAGFDWPTVAGAPAVDLPADPPAGKRDASIGSLALVPRPLPIEGLRSWSLDLIRHRGAISAAAVHPSGLLVCTAGGDDGTIRLWDLTGRLRRILPGHGTDSARSVATVLSWSPDGRRLASAGSDRNLRIWDAAAGRPLQTYTLEIVPGRLVWSADGMNIAATGAQGWMTIDLASRKVQSRPDAPGGVDLWWPEPGLLAVLGADGVIRTWDLQTQALDSEQRLAEFAPPVVCEAMSPDRRAIALVYGPAGDRLGVWDLKSGTSKKSVDESPNFAQRLAWSASGRLMTAGSRLRAWDGETLHEQWRSAEFPSPIAGIGWAADDHVVMATQGGLRVYHRDGELLATTPPGGQSRLGGYALLDVDRTGNGWWSRSDGSRLALGWDLRTGRQKNTIRDPIWFRVSPDGEWLCEWATPVRLFETRTGTMKHQFDIPQQSDEVAWSHDSKSLAVAKVDGAVDIRDIATSASIGELRAPDKAWPFRHVKFSPDNQRLAAAADVPGRLVMWDVKSREILWRTDEILSGGISGCTFDWSPDGAELAVWKADGSIVRLDAGTGKLRAPALPVRVRGAEVRYSPDGKYLAVTESEATAVIELATGKEFRLPFVGVIRWLPGTQTLLLTPWNRDSEVIAYDVGRRRYEGTLLPLIDSKDHLCIGPDGYYRGSAGIEQHLVYIAEDEEGRQEIYTPADFARKFGWKNDPEQARIVPESSDEN